MRKLTFLLACLLLVGVGLVNAQSKSITGKVISADDGQPVIGATVKVKGASLGTVTNTDGVFKISVPDNSKTLVVSYVGMNSVSIDAQNNLTIKLTADSKMIDEVVVTALGIKREKKALGYSVSNVGGGDLQKSNEPNVIEGLAGKVAGVQVTGTSGTPGASSRIIIRGQKSINLTSQPLIVLDGQIIDNSINNNAGTNTNIGGVDDSNRAIDINPDDIESVSVLKGSAAAALYGESARNGVIIYISKKGSKRKGLGVDFTASTGLDVLSNMIDLQKTYAAGTNGTTYIAPSTYKTNGLPTKSGGTNQSWGPLISSVSGLNAYDNVNNFFKTGLTQNYNIAFSGGNDKGNFRASLGHLDQSGIVPNTSLVKTNFNINADYNLTDKLTMGADALFTNTSGVRAQKGSNVAGIMLSLLRSPASYDLRNYQNSLGYNQNYLYSYDNPFYTVYNNPYTDQTNRLILNGHLDYKYSKWFNAMLRAGADTYTTHAQQNYSYSSRGNTAGDGTGQVVLDTYAKSLYNVDLIFNGLVNLTSDINLNYNVGSSINTTSSNDMYTQGATMLVPNQYNLSNFSTFTPQNYDSKQIKEGVYGSLEFDFYDQAYLTMTGRNDWASTLPQKNRSFFYPSISGSWLFNKTLDLPRWISLGKVRASFAKTYAAPGPYNLLTTYTTPYYYDTFNPQLYAPYNGVGAFGYSATSNNANLKPEQNDEYEVGLELELFNRLHLNVSAYTSTNSDLLLLAPVAPSSGFQYAYINGPSVENKGLEIELGYDILKGKDLEWNVTANWSLNRNKVVKVLNNGYNSNYSIEGSDYFSGSSPTPEIILGQPLGVFYGSYLERNTAGNLIIGSDGLPILATDSKIIGDPTPTWLGSLRNNFKYKDISLSFLFDVRKGGDIWDGTLARLNRLGVTQASANNRAATYVIPGVLADGSTNNISISNKTYYVSYLGDGSGSSNETAIEKNINWIRLRDVSLGYNFTKLLSSLSFVKNAQLTLSARNLFIITNYKGIDPENSFAGSSSPTLGFDYFNNPNTRSYYLTLKLSF